MRDENGTQAIYATKRNRHGFSRQDWTMDTAYNAVYVSCNYRL